MKKKLLLASVGAAAALIFAFSSDVTSFAQGTLAYVQNVVGSSPPNVNFSELTTKCVNSNISSLATGQSIPLPCNSGGQLVVSVAATLNGFDSGPVQVVSPTLNAGSYSAGMSLGGLFTVPIARTNGGSGGLALIGYKSTAGSVGQVVFRVWQKNPAATTCTDHTAFVSNATDDAQLLVAPFALTPAAPAVTTGDAATYAVLQPGRLSWVNSDTSPSKNLYVCVLTVATDTVDESSTVAVRLSGDLN